ncbi:uncharacterized protein LOC115627957 [Scaptodrosophila lebanonensis]|uniref:Uncharacterized protein LOC115627957 n=1 Tax=Drosophila lebanonensis TaxID=7225 RepID=A0A6J2TT03_DROLE|nr:uncharacterized protein LOC115627957 [Scaptodrosophila lebanonensis]
MNECTPSAGLREKLKKNLLITSVLSQLPPFLVSAGSALRSNDETLPHSFWASLGIVCLMLLVTQPCSVSSLSQTPPDHLVPPPLPTPQRLQHSFAQSEALRPPPPPPPSSALGATSAQHPDAPGPGFMTRIARWFGLGAPPPREQQLSASSHSYAYPKPAQSYDGKPCSLCNKYPWVPMLPAQLQPHQQHQHQQNFQNTWPQLEAQPSQHKQRAVQFHAPQQSLFVPMTLPGALSSVALPPLYNAQPFRPLIGGTSGAPSSTLSAQQLPTTQPAHFAENVGAHSELRPDRVPVLPTQLPPSTYPAVQHHSNNKDSSFEIVPSHQLTDFVTSVEYPATFVQSHAIDLGSSDGLPQQEQQHQQQHQHQQETLDVGTVRYQLEDLQSGPLSQHVPASQLLTELGHYTAATQLLEHTSSTPSVELETQPTTPAPSHYYETPAADNFPAASSQQQQQHNHYALWRAQTDVDYVEALPSTSTLQPFYEQVDYTSTQPPEPESEPAVELNNNLAGGVHSKLPFRLRDRDTPKRLLDAPIKYVQQGAGPPPRPFTRDPADLNFRLSQMYTPTQQPVTASLAVTQPPTPTSTYGAIDASGQYAGMSPPSPQQVIIPYTTKNKPRPFEPTRSGNIAYDGWTHAQGHANDVELHEQQESKLVSTATAPPPPNTRRTTKYLTKILASNLRELLKRERETKSRPLGHSFDIGKLQQNIDGWTEQEYTSLSHRPSTPTIRGRSKHIPTEYLTTTTTPTPRHSKTNHGGFELGGSHSGDADVGDLSTSINNLEHRGSKRFQYVSPIEDNRLLDFYEAQQRTRTPATTTTPMTPTSTPLVSTTGATDDDDNDPKVTPLYVRGAVPTLAPAELWQKAKVAILPQTNEKVYVVTPQPRYYSTEAPPPAPVYISPAAKARFMVRPTPGNVAQAAATPSSAQQHNYTPDIFGLMGLSAYVPADPVEIIDGNSKVITIVTPTPKAAALQRLPVTAKPTMSPSPR